MPGKPWALRLWPRSGGRKEPRLLVPQLYLHRTKPLINPYLPSRRYLRVGAECPDTPYTMIDFLKIRAPFRYFIYCLNIFANVSASPLSSSADGSRLSPPAPPSPDRPIGRQAVCRSCSQKGSDSGAALPC